MTLVECIPNFSEGRDPETIAAIRDEIERVRGVRVLDVSSDPWHHRSVVTFAGPAELIVDAAFAAVREARERIDLRHHRGQHPRMGATDVVPLVPLHGVSMEDCIELSRTLAERVGNELEIPVFLYERSALRADRRDLAAIRRDGFEGLSELIGHDPLRVPDYGPPRIHPTAGACAIGARAILVAFNVFLGPEEKIEAVREIARTLRGSSGGLPGVKALAFIVNGRAQLSMNLTDLEAAPAHVAYEALLREADRHGLRPEGSELVGLAPERFFHAAGARALGLSSDSERQVLERRIRESGLEQRARAEHDERGDAAERVRSAGSAAALAASFASQLLVRLARRAGTAAAAELANRAQALATRLDELAELDSAAYDALLAAEALPLQAEDRDAVVVAAVMGASGIPLEIARSAASLAALALEVSAPEQVPYAATDALTIALVAEGAAVAAVALIRTNISRLRDPASARGMLEAGEEFASRVKDVVKVLSGGLPTVA